MNDKRLYRLYNKDGLIMYTGTAKGSWMSLKEARELVNYSLDESIHEYSECFMYHLWEIL